MQNKFINLSLLLFIATSILAFKVGEHIEIEAYLNARSSSSFLKTSGNIKTQLSKGTKGEILETQKMPSGNYGIKMKVENGPHRGESYWVYYNLKAPLMKLLNTDQVEKAKNAVLTSSQPAIRDPDEAAVINAAQTAVAALKNKSISSLTSSVKNADCPPIALATSNVSEDQYVESDIVTPYREMATSALHSPICRTSDNGYEVCTSKEDSKKIEKFTLTNSGPNNIVKKNEYFINRTMSFEYEDRARSDIKLIVCDSPDETTSHATYSIMMFFPRSVLPAIKKIGNVLEVTLPNREIVRYNAITKEIIGGVFTEKPMIQDSKSKAVPANISYSGNGVMIRADKSGDLPYGDIELNNGKSAKSTSIATISKKGFKDCKIPSKDIWYTDNSKGGNVFIKPELAKDDGIDKFIKTKCGFSIY